MINDEANEIANASVEAALKTLRDKYNGHLGQVYTVQANGSDPQDSLRRICDAWERAIGTGDTGRAPDFVLSTAIAGWTVEASNSFSSALGLPTLSAQYGQEEDSRYWNNLDHEKRSYLVQVMPPADLLPGIIRKLAIYLKITNAAILFDRNFDMSHKYNGLLLNVPTRHVINDIARNVDDMKEQFSRMRDLDVVNYFILAEGRTIDMVLETAEALHFTGHKYGWFALTMEKDIWPNCDCKNISLLFMKPEFQDTEDTTTIAKDDSLEATLPSPLLSSAFYYDLTLLGVETMKTAIEREEWPVLPYHIGCDDYDGNNTPTRNFDFLERLRTTSRNMTPTYAAFKWGQKNGEHGADFRVSINLVYIEKGTLTYTENVGSWSAGVDSPLEASSQILPRI